MISIRIINHFLEFLWQKSIYCRGARTAGGKRDGRLSLWHPADLGAKVLDEIASRLDMILS